MSVCVPARVHVFTLQFTSLHDTPDDDDDNDDGDIDGMNIHFTYSIPVQMDKEQRIQNVNNK